MAGKREAALPSPDVTLAGSESGAAIPTGDERGSRSVAVKGIDKTGNAGQHPNPLVIRGLLAADARRQSQRSCRILHRRPADRASKPVISRTPGGARRHAPAHELARSEPRAIAAHAPCSDSHFQKSDGVRMRMPRNGSRTMRS